MINKNFRDIDYLKYGNDRQKKSYKILNETNIFYILKKYSPILVGTIPIGIDVNNSDLDIVCKVSDFNEFKGLLDANFSIYNGYSIKYNEFENILVCNFYVDNVEIEIYGSELDSVDTNGYRHMIVENRILSLANEEFKEAIIDLKRGGLKTEPAFSKMLNLSGNPYEELLKFEKYSNIKILNIINRSNNNKIIPTK